MKIGLAKGTYRKREQLAKVISLDFKKVEKAIVLINYNELICIELEKQLKEAHDHLLNKR